MLSSTVPGVSAASWHRRCQGVFKKVGSRYTSLEKLRKAGGDPEATTQVFDNYLTNQLSEYVRFHDFCVVTSDMIFGRSVSLFCVQMAMATASYFLLSWWYLMWRTCVLRNVIG